ncbi:hypothetical protein F511_43415 [Dorcoceras hygrometricum]|uniref:Uncharacterized protein n=1 Tax=Dorcoceras hygrometricum TaxID=472368 RepID=A0A2Z6ZYK2_9LAMI|nr:hypothetical protein F511_43415 [Dorcoceras hygrometricum]
MNSSRICPAVGSQYKDSAVGLVFMESAAGLAMETSKVESVVRNQAEAKLNQLEHSEPAGTMTTSFSNQQMRREVKEMKRRRAEGSADGLALMMSSVTSSYSADGLSPAVASYQQRFALALKIQQILFALLTSRKIPVASYSGSSRKIHPVNKIRWIQSRASVLCIQSQRSRSKKSRCSEALQPGAKYPVDKDINRR